MVWKPNVTVAAVIEREGKFLLVEEETDEGLLFNQPAGHLEEGESLVAGARRETLEESGWDFTPERLVGIYRWQRPGGAVTYLRFAFAGKLGAHHAGRKLDAGIVRAVWMSPDEVRATATRHRSPLVVRCMEDFLRGFSAPLELLVDFDGTHTK
jgi:ADP-ribose pyrophosphatase YjhB (NUDIX family)